MIIEAFTTHPRSVGESYGEHLGMAFGFAGALALATLACAVHALLPFLFEKTGSRIIDDLHSRMVRNRRVKPLVEESAAGLAGKA